MNYSIYSMSPAVGAHNARKYYEKIFPYKNVHFFK